MAGASFFGASTSAASPDFDFSRARHVALDRTSWIEHIPDWLAQPGALFAELMETAPWLQRDRWMYTRTVIEPRLTADYPDVAEVSRAFARGKTVILTAMQHRWGPVAALCRRLEEFFGCPVHTNLYLTPPGAQGFDRCRGPPGHGVIPLGMDPRTAAVTYPRG